MRIRALLLLAAAASFSAGTALAQTVVTQSNGRLTLTTANADQSVKVEIGPIAGVARVSGFAGINDGQTYSGVTGLTVRTGAGKDSVEVLVEAPQSLDLTINTGTGDSETKVKWTILAGVGAANATIDIASATAGNQIASVEVDSQAQNATVTVRAPSASEATAKIQSSNFSNLLRAVVDSAAPKFTLDLASSASVLEVDVRGGSASRANELAYTIAQGRAAPVSINWAITGSNVSDKIEAKVSASGATITQQGLVRTLGGDDLAQFETDSFGTVSGLTLNGGAGNDSLAQIVKGRYLNSQTLQTQLFGGDGDDELVLRTDTGIFGTGLPNDQPSIIDCGPGNDRFGAFGIIRSCETRI